MRFVWFSLGQKLSRGLNDRGTLKDTETSTKMRFCLVIYSLLNLWKLSWEFPGNSSIQLLLQLLKVDFTSHPLKMRLKTTWQASSSLHGLLYDIDQYFHEAANIV